MCILPLSDGSFYLWCKAVEMEIIACIAVWVGDHQGMTFTIFLDDGSGNVAVGDGVDPEVDFPVGLDINPSVKVIGARLAEVACQLYGDVDGRSERQCG